MITVRAAIGCGSNLGDSAALVTSACDALAKIPSTRLLRRSSIYRSIPLSGAGSQPDYANAAATVETGLAPFELLEALLAIERAHGRVRAGDRWASRLLDLDLLIFGDLCLAHPGLHIPHPELARRNFVLEPLAEIAPDWQVPGQGAVAELYAKLDWQPLPRWA